MAKNEQLTLDVEVKGASGVDKLADSLKEIEDASKDASRGVQQLSDEFKKIGDVAKVDVQLGSEVPRVRDTLEHITDIFDEIDGESVKADVSVDTATVEGDLDKVDASLTEIDGRTVKADVSVDTSGVEAGLSRTKKGLDDTRNSSDQTKSVMANMAGNTAQELGELGGVVGSLGVGIGQMAEYAAEGNISLSQLSKLAGPVGLLSAISVGVALFSKWKAAAAELAENTRQATEAFEEGVGSIDDWTDAVDEAFETGTAGATAFSREILRALETSMDPAEVNDLRVAMSKLGLTFEDLSDLTRTAEADFAAYATAEIALKGATDEVAGALGPLVKEFGGAEEILADLRVTASQTSVIFDEFGNAIPIAEVIAFVEGNKDFIDQLDEIEEGFNRVDLEKAAQNFLRLEKSVDPATRALVQQSIETTRAADGTIDYIAALEDYIGAQQDRARADEEAARRAAEYAEAVEAGQEAEARTRDEHQRMTLTTRELARELAAMTDPLETLPFLWDILIKKYREGTLESGTALDAINQLAEATKMAPEDVLALVAAESELRDTEVADKLREDADAARELAAAMAEVTATIADINVDDIDNMADALGGVFDVADRPLDFEILKASLSVAIDELQKLVDEKGSLDWNTALAGVRDQFQTGIVEAFRLGGRTGAEGFTAEFIQVLSQATGLSPEEIYGLVGLPPDGSVEAKLRLVGTEESKADAERILADLKGIAPEADPVIAYIKAGLQTGGVDPVIAEISALLLAQQLGIPVAPELLAFTPEQIDAAEVVLSQAGMTAPITTEVTNAAETGEVIQGIVVPRTAPVAVDDDGTVDEFAEDADEATADRTTQVIVPKSDSLGAMQTLIDHVARARTVNFNSKADNAGQIDGILDAVAGRRDAPIYVVLPNAADANRTLNQIAQQRNATIVVRTVSTGSTGGGGGPTAGGLAAPFAAPTAAPFAAPLVDGEEDVGVAPLAAPAMSSVSSSGVAIVGTAPTSTVTNNYKVEVRAAVIGNRHEVNREVARALRAHARLNGSRN